MREGDDIDLGRRPTNVEPFYKSKDQYQKLLQEHIAQLSKLQQLHYASDRYAVLLICQAMDAAGKDGAIRHVMSSRTEKPSLDTGAAIIRQIRWRPANAS
ncbi:hypothetical protein [Methylocella silvestris]|uniref:hypothetical protein n=1 Tax=Methylocella silvestris TaxID=199596 RepID=UPI001FE08E95|nr:hypothetical protein [Methylocella silvestris]